MRITMIVHREITYDTRVQREARALAAAGHEVTVVQLGAVQQPSRPGGYGFEVVPVEPSPSLKRRVPLKAYRVLFGLAVIQAALRTRPDVVHAHDVAMLAPAYVVARLSRACLVYDSHELATGVPYRTRGWAVLVRVVERLLIRRCDAVITVSDGIARRLADMYRLDRRPLVLRNVPEEEVAAAAGTVDLRAALGLDAAPVVLHQGAAAEGRGCEALVAAMRHLPDSHLVFLGGGEPAYLEQLRGLVSREGLEDRVHFLPSVPAEQLSAYTRQVDVGVTMLEDNCENHRLALPNKVFEYVAARVPVVSNDLPELRSLIETRRIGWTTPSLEPEALARVLGGAAGSRNDPELQSNLSRAADELSWTRERSRLVELYAALRGPRQRARR